MPLETSAERHNHRPEGGYEQLATKADLADLRAELKTDIALVESRLLRWMIAMVCTAIVVATSVASLIQTFID